MTFRIDPELAQVLRRLPNQTRFVEAAIKEALGESCPVCGGSGRLTGGALRVSDFREAALPRLDREGAAHLKGLVRCGRRMLATALELEADASGTDLGFRIARDEETLLSGRLSRADGTLHLN